MYHVPINRAKTKKKIIYVPTEILYQQNFSSSSMLRQKQKPLNYDGIDDHNHPFLIFEASSLKR